MSRYNNVFLLVAGLVAAAAIRPSLESAANPHLLHDLARARPGRTTAARLSIQTEYRPCATLPAGGGGTVAREACGADEAPPLRVEALDAARQSSDPDSLQAAALAAVVWWDGTEPSLDDAVARLTRALRLSRRPVSLLVDLSGTHLVRAERTQNPRDLVQGLSYAREALSREPRNPAALFNAALALELLAIDEEAVLRWDAYLVVDSVSGWAEEARRRKAGVLERRLMVREPGPGAPAREVEAFAARYPQEARLLGWDHVLGEWGAAVERGEWARAEAFATQAERLGSALELRGGDATLADAVRAVRTAAPDSASTRTLARAHRAYAAGQALYRTYDHPAALDSFAKVIEARPRSPVLLKWARAFRGGALVYASDYAAADTVFSTLLSGVDTTRYPALAARARWMWSTALLRNGRYPEARSQYGAAAGTFARLGEREFLGATLMLDGETAYEQGDTLVAYRSMHRALLALRGYRSSVWLHNQLLKLADCARIDGMPWAAASFQDEDVRVAMRLEAPVITVEALLARARARAIAGEPHLATRDLEAAAPLAGKVQARRARIWADTNLRYSRVLVQSGTRAIGSVEALDSVVSFFSDNVVWLLPALMRRADARLARGDLAGAVADLDTATIRIRGLSGRERAASVRAAMIDQARSRFDQLVMLHVRAGRARKALQALERGRVSFVAVPDAHAPAAGSQPAAPRGHVAVEFALIGDTLLTWTVRDTVVHLLRRTVDRDELLYVVEQVGAALETPARTAKAQPGLESLYDWLVRPVRDRLGASETPLVILADGELAGVPFAALRDGERGRYLVEDHPLRFAVSLADAARPPLATRPGLALLVANPTFDPLAYPTLDPLRRARAESDSLRGLYPRHLLLEGRSATRSALQAWAPRASVIHYAGHAVFDDARPERSFLVLAGEGASGRLSAEAVNRLELGGVRLVVLSACRTLRSRGGRSGGFAGLSGALLGAGVEGVVGSLWKVDDRLTQPFMLAFHRGYRRSGDPAGALRQAQLRLLRSSDPVLRSPASWAGFRFVGR